MLFFTDALGPKGTCTVRQVHTALSPGPNARSASYSRAMTNTACSRNSRFRPACSRSSIQQLSAPEADSRNRNSEKRREYRLPVNRSEEHTSELQSLRHLACRLLLE